MSRWSATALLSVIMIAGCKTKQADPAPATAHAASPARSTTPGEPPRLPEPAGSAEAARPAAPAPSAAELEARSVTAMQHLADVIAVDARDCEKLAGDLRTFAAENRPLLGQLFALQQQPTAAQGAAYSRRAAAVAAGQKLQAAIAICASNPSVVAAMKEFPAE